MKDIDKKDAPDISGGYTVGDEVSGPAIVDYPPIPFGPFPDPIPDPTGDSVYKRPR